MTGQISRHSYGDLNQKQAERLKIFRQNPCSGTPSAQAGETF
jgi:hypothetical protein